MADSCIVGEDGMFRLGKFCNYVQHEIVVLCLVIGHSVGPISNVVEKCVLFHGIDLEEKVFLSRTLAIPGRKADR